MAARLYGAATLLVLAFTFHVADSKVHTFDWTTAEGDAGFPMPQVDCGDTIQLKWPKNETHGVFKVADLSATAPCPAVYTNTNKSQMLVKPQAGGNFSYVVEDELSFWFLDPTPGACEAGMAIMPMVNCGTRKATMDDSSHSMSDDHGGSPSPGMVMSASPSSPTVHTFDWTTAEGDAGFPMPQVDCGDTIQLKWPKNETHGVFKVTDSSATAPCPAAYTNTNKSQLLVKSQAGGNFSYVVKDEPSFWFLDPTPGACEAGMAIMPMVNCGTRKATMDDSAHSMSDDHGGSPSPGMVMSASPSSPTSPAPASPSPSPSGAGAARMGRGALAALVATAAAAALVLH